MAIRVAKITELGNQPANSIGIYVGRTKNVPGIFKQGLPNYIDLSVLGNPYIMRSENEREMTIRMYESYIRTKILDHKAPETQALAKIGCLARTADVILYCFCHPKHCHADVIADIALGLSKQINT